MCDKTDRPAVGASSASALEGYPLKSKPEGISSAPNDSRVAREMTARPTSRQDRGPFYHDGQLMRRLTELRHEQEQLEIALSLLHRGPLDGADSIQLHRALRQLGYTI